MRPWRRRDAISTEAVGRAARFACDEVVRLPERKARTPKGPQGPARDERMRRLPSSRGCHARLCFGPPAGIPRSEAESPKAMP